MAEASPQVSKLAQLAAMANNSPQAAAQRKMADMIHSGPRMAAQGRAASAIHNSPNVTAQRQQFDSLNAETAQLEEAEEPAQREAAPAKPNNTGLPDNLKSGIESLSGISMDNVRVHYNSSQPAQLNAHAYAQGTDIHVAPGQEQHLPHEAWHVVQQAQGRVQPTMQMKGSAQVNDDAGLENEADAMGGREISDGMGQGQTNESALIDKVSLVSTIQRVVAGVAGGLGTIYHVKKGDLNNGTPSTQAARNKVQNLGVFWQNPVNLEWNAGMTHVGPLSISNPTTPKYNGLHADAGHRLAKQNGGDGNDVFAQNTYINRGWDQGQIWRSQEQAFHNNVNSAGSGWWSVDVPMA